jgi:hypothetical protein
MRCNLLDERKPFRAHAALDRGNAGDVATRLCETLDQALRLGYLHENHGHAARRLPQRACGYAARSEHDIGSKCGEFSRIGASAFRIVGAPAGIDREIAAPTQLPQGLHEDRKAGLRFSIIGAQTHQHAKTAHAIWLLGACSDRPCQGHAATKVNDEFASSHGGASED